ncbi:unnamed protein product [Brassica napus]|uniref:(rape) hypothetical protein n=1 Tax=Brassica napus TaxID=3708 RepID=A0A816RYU4_BRANA|nr:unnamed protein product [Brassica napus]
MGSLIHRGLGFSFDDREGFDLRVWILIKKNNYEIGA